MAIHLPGELLDTLQQQLLIRQAQLEHISLLYNNIFPSPIALVAYGTEDTYKLETIEAALKTQRVYYVVINCRECLSQRHLLTKIFARCVAAHNQEEDLDQYDRLESINALASNLRRLLLKRMEKLVVVIDGIDQQRGATATLLPALARLGDLIPCLSVILTTSSPRPLSLHKAGVQYIHFSPYSRNEAIHILLRDPPPILPDPLPHFAPSINRDKLQKTYNQFATIVYETLIAPTTNSISKYRQTCSKLWPRFVWPILSGEKPTGRGSSTEWDFARLLARSRSLFQAEGEEAIQDRLLPINTKPWTFEDLIAQKLKEDAASLPNPLIDPVLQSQQNPNPSTSQSSLSLRPAVHAAAAPTDEKPLLKFLPTLLLLSCYLASHTHPKHDIVLFSRLSNASSTSRRKRKYLARSRAGGISKSPSKKSTAANSATATGDNGDDDNDAMTLDAQTPTKKKRKDLGNTSGETTATTPKKERADRSMRAIFEKTSNVARPFILERVIAILRAIHPEGVKNGKGIADRVYVELGELERLRLVVRADRKRSSNSEDVVMEEKWKCVVSREWVVQAGKWYGLSIEGWEVVAD